MLIAVAGFSGAGKTTAVERLAGHGGGGILYAGGYVLAEVERRGLDKTAASEKAVRAALRDEFGPDVLAVRAIEDVRAMQDGVCILLDAVCLLDERDRYRADLDRKVVILGIEAPFEQRAARLALRKVRPLTSEELQKRDRFEADTLGLGTVLAEADHSLVNRGRLDEFLAELDALAARIIPRS